MSTSTLVNWDDGQGILLNRETLEQAGFNIGDTLEINVQHNKITITPAGKQSINVLDYGKLFANYNGPQPVEDGFAAPVGKEKM